MPKVVGFLQFSTWSGNLANFTASPCSGLHKSFDILLINISTVRSIQRGDAIEDRFVVPKIHYLHHKSA